MRALRGQVSNVILGWEVFVSRKRRLGKRGVDRPRSNTKEHLVRLGITAGYCTGIFLNNVVERHLYHGIPYLLWGKVDSHTALTFEFSTEHDIKGSSEDVILKSGFLRTS